MEEIILTQVKEYPILDVMYVYGSGDPYIEFYFFPVHVDGINPLKVYIN
jgi:hypothetical protein